MSEKKIIHEPKIVVDSRSTGREVVAKPLSDDERKAREQSDATPGVANVMPVFDPNKKTILYVITKANWGGAQKYVYDLAVHFSKDYNVAVAFGKNEFSGKNIFREKLEDLGVQVYPIANLGKKMVLANEISAMIELFKIVRKIKPEIMHLNSPKAGGIGGLVGKMLGVKRTVYTVHGLNSFEDRKGYEVAIVNTITKWILNLSHRIIAISQLEMDFIVNKWNLGKKTSLIYNGTHPIDFIDGLDKRTSVTKDAPQSVREKMMDPQTIIIGSIAEMRADKGIFFTIDALRVLKEKGIPFVYIHYGEGDQKHVLEMEVKQFDLEGHVLFKGFDRQAANYLRMFDIFVLPSLKEGLPYVLLESAAAGNAVVASGVNGVPEIIEDSVTGILVEPKNTEQLSEALMTLAQDKSLREQYGQALKKHAEETFSLQKMFDKTGEIYKS